MERVNPPLHERVRRARRREMTKGNEKVARPRTNKHNKCFVVLNCDSPEGNYRVRSDAPRNDSLLGTLPLRIIRQVLRRRRRPSRSYFNLSETSSRLI